MGTDPNAFGRGRCASRAYRLVDGTSEQYQVRDGSTQQELLFGAAQAPKMEPGQSTFSLRIGKLPFDTLSQSHRALEQGCLHFAADEISDIFVLMMNHGTIFTGRASRLKPAGLAISRVRGIFAYSGLIRKAYISEDFFLRTGVLVLLPVIVELLPGKFALRLPGSFKHRDMRQRSPVVDEG